MHGSCVPCRATDSGSSLMSPTDHAYVGPLPSSSTGLPPGGPSNDWPPQAGHAPPQSTPFSLPFWIPSSHVT
ncbi:hypothetical protein BE20_07945 [Sorangium cellulosum]|nr:hypothetical protein BE20_07945 [Sorangium cellulosum]